MQTNETEREEKENLSVHTCLFSTHPAIKEVLEGGDDLVGGTVEPAVMAVGMPEPPLCPQWTKWGAGLGEAGGETAAPSLVVGEMPEGLR